MAADYIYTPDQVLQWGLRLVATDGPTARQLFRQKRETQLNDFKAVYGVQPSIIAQVWEDLQTTNIVAARIDTTKKRSVHLKNFLRTHLFLKQYPTEAQRKTTHGNTEKTIRKWCLYFLERLQALKAAKIVWPNDDEWFSHFIVSVDGVHCLFHEVKHPTLSQDPNLFSWKHHGPGLSYELALHIFEPRLVWVKQNTHTKTNDRQNFIEPGGLRDRIPAGKKAITDRGYRGDPKVAHPNSHDPPELSTFKARARMRQESFHKRIKCFRCMDTKFRHSRQYHQMCFEAICVLLVYEMELILPLFDV